MTVWADADSLPRDVREILQRRAAAPERGGPKPAVVFVASRKVPGVPPDLLVTVPPGQDSADAAIEERALPGDIAVTRDLPLAERLAMRGVSVLNDRGDLFTAENVRERRSARDRALELRALGLAPESPRSTTRTRHETKLFADALDRAITAAGRNRQDQG